MHVGDRLRELREAAGLNLPEAAAIAGTSKQSASQIEKGVTKVPGGLFLYRWSQHYGVNLEWLITGRGTAKQSQSQPPRLSPDTIQSAYRLAVGAIEARGDWAGDFDPANDAEEAEYLGLAIEWLLVEQIAIASDSDVLRYARSINKKGAGDGSGAEGGSDGAAAGDASVPEARGKGKAKAGKQRERAA